MLKRITKPPRSRKTSQVDDIAVFYLNERCPELTISTITYMKKSNSLLLFLIISLISFNCTCPPELTNLSKAKQAVIQYHESGEYDADVQAVINEAKEKFNEINISDSTAIVFDVDETALSNYEKDKNLDFGYVPSEWSKWVEEARAPAIKPVKEFYDFLLLKGSKIIFITGRTNEQSEATRRNLVSQGYTTFDTIITRAPEEKDVSAVDYKSAKRAALTAKGYIIAGTVGDQWSDLKGEYHGIQVKIPNFTYELD